MSKLAVSGSVEQLQNFLEYDRLCWRPSESKDKVLFLPGSSPIPGASVDQGAAILPPWMATALSGSATLPMDFIDRITPEDIKTTAATVRALIATEEFREDVNTVLGRVRNRSYAVQETERAVWLFVARHLVSSAFWRYVREVLFHLKGAPAPTGDAKRFCKGLFRVGAPDVKFKLNRLVIPDDPSVSSRSLVNQVVAAMARVASGDPYQGPYVESNAVANTLTIHSRARLAPIFRGLADDGMLMVDDALLMLPHEAHTSIRWLFQNSLHITKRFNALPLTKENMNRAMLSTRRAKLDEAFAYREVRSIGGGSEPNADSAKARKGVTDATPPMITPAPIGCVTTCAATLAFTDLQQRLSCAKRDVPRRCAVKPLAIGYQPVYLRSKSFERGLFDAVVGPVAQLCQEIWGTAGDQSLRSVVVGSSMTWAWDPVEITTDAELPGILERARDRTKAWYATDNWEDPQAVVPSDKAWELSVVQRREALEEQRPTKKRRVDYEPPEPRMSRDWHFRALHTRMGLNDPARRAAVIFPK